MKKIMKSSYGSKSKEFKKRNMEPQQSYFTHNINRDADGDIAVDGVKVKNIADQFGTPTYVYSEDAIVTSAKHIIDCFSRHHEGGLSIHYSLKANANFSIVKALLKTGAGIDCVSGGEVYKAIRAGCSPDHIVFAGVGKDQESIDYAVSVGVGWFNVENELELTYISNAAQKYKRVVCAALRLNPDVKADTMAHIATGHKDAKFGVPMETAKEILDNPAKYPHVQVKGIHVHIGSQLGSIDDTVAAVRIALTFCDDYGLTHINVGGGFPISYDGSSKPDVEAFAKVVGPLTNGKHLMLEPGRRIVGHAGLLLTRVLYHKKPEKGNKRFLIVDASMTELMRPALYGAHHEILPATKVDGATAHFSIVGPVCETTDVLGEADVPDQGAEGMPGTLLAIMSAGAYGFAMANNYNARPLPPQIIIREGKPYQSTKRQTFEDLVRDEIDL